MKTNITERGCPRDARAARNRRCYPKSLVEQDRVLLLLDKGGTALLDRCALAAGLSHAAFARMVLPSLLEAVGTRLRYIHRARAAGGQSLPKFLARAVDGAIQGPDEETAICTFSAAAEFDQLFG